MADLIDRDAAISKFIEGDGDDEFTNGYNFAVDEYRKKISDIPAVNRWIPCSERLPENKGRYLCSLYYAIPPYHLLHPENDTYIREVSVQYFDGKSFISSVVAWMPMPDAYEPPESEVKNEKL